MRNKLIALILCAIFAALTAFTSFGEASGESCTLTLEYGEYPGMEVRLYYAAQYHEDQTFTLAGDFAEYPVKVSGITSQEEWRAVASTLAAYAAADGLLPVKSGVTDEEGRVVFSGLERGLYLIPSVLYHGEDEGRVFESFLTVLPAVDSDGAAVQDSVAYPKGENVPQEDGEISYKVVKQWKDQSREQERPASVTVDILKNGELYTTQILSSENGWTYSWTDTDKKNVWQAVERQVPENYTVTVEGSGQTLVVVNSYSYESTPPPQTGNTDVLWPYVLAMCVAGTVMLMAAAWLKRKKA